MSSSVCHKVTIMALLLSGSISQSPPSNPCWVRAAGSTESRETETTSSILPGRTSTVDTLACMAHLLAPAFPGGGRLRSDYITGGRANRKTLLPERSGQVGVKGRGCAIHLRGAEKPPPVLVGVPHRAPRRSSAAAASSSGRSGLLGGVAATAHRAVSATMTLIGPANGLRSNARHPVSRSHRCASSSL